MEIFRDIFKFVVRLFKALNPELMLLSFPFWMLLIIPPLLPFKSELKLALTLMGAELGQCCRLLKILLYVDFKNIIGLFIMKTIDLAVNLGSSMISKYLMKFVTPKFRCWKIRCPSQGQPAWYSRQIFLLKLSSKEQKTQLII